MHSFENTSYLCRSMRILIVSTSERTGGAAVAACRLMEALNNNGVKAKMLVRDLAEAHQQDGRPVKECISVASLPRSFRLSWHFLWERLIIFLHLGFARQHLFDIDIANSGSDITQLPEFREADVIHLHWVNQGMLSLADIRKILRSGKPVVWTMHDLWPATAVCHYARGCKKYQDECADCPLFPKTLLGDLARRVWRRKMHLQHEGLIHYVCCSRWLEGETRKSALLQGQPVCNIPNPINSQVYRPAEIYGSYASERHDDRLEARRRLGLPEEGRVLLFVSQKVTDERKGISYLVEAVNNLVEQHPELCADVHIAILGGHAEEIVSELPLPTHLLGYVSDEKTIVSAYHASDVFVTPSLEDNLPNTIMEAMACGVPCVGFRVGGIPEMIDHQKNGYVAELRSAADLARGIYWVLGEADRSALSVAAVRKVAQSYSQTRVAMKYIEVYQEALAHKHFKL